MGGVAAKGFESGIYINIFVHFCHYFLSTFYCFIGRKTFQLFFGSRLVRLSCGKERYFLSMAILILGL